MGFKLKVIENAIYQNIPSVLIQVFRQGISHRYIINTTPNLQRYASNHKLNFQQNIMFLFTKINTETVSGFPSLVYSISNQQNQIFPKIYVSDVMFNYLQQIRQKVGFNMCRFSYMSWSGRLRRGIWDKSIVANIRTNLDFMQIFKTMQASLQKNVKQQQIINAGKYYDPETKIIDDKMVKIQHFDINTNNQLLTNYIFQISQAVAHSDQIQSLVVLHYNSVESIRQIAGHAIFSKYLEDVKRKTRSVVHIVQDAAIVQHSEFKQLVGLFQNAQHIIFNKEFKNKVDGIKTMFKQEKYSSTVSQLSQLFPHYLPNLSDIYTKMAMMRFKKMKNLQDIFGDVSVHAAKKQYIIDEYHATGKAKYKIQQKILQKSLKFAPFIPHQSSSIKSSHLQGVFKKCDPTIYFLGTSSTSTTISRNVSSYLLQLNGMYVMMDCGDGTYAQFLNHFGLAANDVLLKTRVLFISHCHSDHSLGLIQMIAQRNILMKATNSNQKLFLVIPSNLLPWIHQFCELIEDIRMGCQIVFSQTICNESVQQYMGSQPKTNVKAVFKNSKSNFTKGKSKLYLQQIHSLQFSLYLPQWKQYINIYQQKQRETYHNFKQLLAENHITQFEPIPAIHIPHAYGVVISHQSGIKVSFSGDTRPNNKFIQAAQNSTLLIHQATFVDCELQRAKNTKHSTIEQAIEVGLSSNSWKTALTHFAYDSKMMFGGSAFDKYVGDKLQYAQNHSFFAVDHMQSKFSQFPNLPFYSRKISQLLFKSDRK